MAMTQEEIEAKQLQTAEAMRRDGLNPEQRVQQDYFGFEEVNQHFLPDGVSYIEHKKLNHGARVKYLNKVNRDMKVNRASGDASISLKPGDDMNALLLEAVSGWNLTRNGNPVPFQQTQFQSWLEKADPSIIDQLVKAVRLANPWLMAELSIEDIDKEIAGLQEMREAKLKEEEGKVS